MLDEIDRRCVFLIKGCATSYDLLCNRISLVPPFPGLRRFKQGRNFQQWTGDDSKALMKVYVTALEGIVPVDITKTFTAFLDFCYTARKSTLTKDDLDALDVALQRFHHYRTIFQDTGVRSEGFSLPRQHALVHYRNHIQNFGAPNGLCSSITESKHIAAVKKPWRRSNRYNALQQMLTINTRNDQLMAARADFLLRGMLQGTCLGEVLDALSGDRDDGNEDGDSDGDDSDAAPDSDGEDLDSGLDVQGNRNEGGSSGPVDGLPIFSEVTLALKRGTPFHTTSGYD